ncbi:MAG: hypothetical protein H6704_14910 [Myxococcales bacterium]|nr:hypothetical protein [Myxococcales bacterium]
MIERFFREIDAAWQPSGVDRIQLQVIGSAALMLQASYARGTKDSDVIETDEVTGTTRARLLDLAGKATPMARRHGMYLDVVARGLPFLPQVPRWHPVPSLGPSLRHFEVLVLDVVDVVVSKLKRYSANDATDVAAMVDLGFVPHERLIDRFEQAVDWFSCDARAEDLPKYVRRLHQVERDLFGVAETAIELPSWI